uniref:Hydroxylysine kinase n=1 Tax=Timema tahoe TaxID=61484 RepID=A0A7R9IBF6_9NEOP|nr:unnamed protein product [Timema tahoe]
MSESKESMEEILQPGVQIRPIISPKEVSEIVQRLYGLRNIQIVELNAYDDKNYHIQVRVQLELYLEKARILMHKDEMQSVEVGWEKFKNSLVISAYEVSSEYNDTINPDGYVFKVMNSLDSQKHSFIEAQNELLMYLDSNGFNCPKPVKNVDGLYYSVEKLPQNGDDSFTSDHVVRLLTYQPGSVFQQVLHSRELFFSAGQFVAKLDQALKGFHHPAYESYSSLWELKSAPLLRKFIFAVREEERKQLVEEVLHSFEKNVLPSLETFEKGTCIVSTVKNILVSSTGEDDPWQITAILDFGDTHISCYLFELAITLCYMMLLPCEGMDPLDVGAHVLAGYSTVRVVPVTELQSLKTCICTRLCQSLVMGEYSHLQDPGNDYLLTTAKTGWGLLQTLWGTGQDELEQRWRTIMATYQESIPS